MSIDSRLWWPRSLDYYLLAPCGGAKEIKMSEVSQYAGDLQVLVSRSHFHQLAVCAAYIGELEEAKYGESGWTTHFDGGQNTHAPSDFVVLYGEAAEWDEREGKSSVLYALVVRDPWLQDRSRGKKVLLRHTKFGSDVRELRFGGLEVMDDAYWKACGYWSDGRGENDWEILAETDVPDYIRQMLEKTIAAGRQNFGQGHEFFLVEKSK
jgi:hypothetical protein